VKVSSAREEKARGVKREEGGRGKGRRGEREENEAQTHLRESSELIVDSSNSLLDRLLEGPSNAHDLSNTLHARVQRGRDPRELLEIPSRDFDDDVVERGLEASGGDLGDRVSDLVERDVETELGGDEGERVSGGLGGESGGSRETSVDFDDAVLLGVGVESVLDVAPVERKKVREEEQVSFEESRKEGETKRREGTRDSLSDDSEVSNDVDGGGPKHVVVRV